VLVHVNNIFDDLSETIHDLCSRTLPARWSILLLLLWSHSIWAQPTKQPRPFPTTVDNVKFTDVVRDSNNYIWVSCFGALERYDGTLVKRFDSRGNFDLLYRLFVDNKNRVWSVDMVAGFSYMEGDTARPYKYNGQVKYLAEGGNLRTMSFKQDGSIKLASDYHGYFELDTSGSLTKILGANVDCNGWVFVEGEDGSSHTFFSHNQSYVEGDTFNLYVFDEQHLRFSIPINVSEKIRPALIGRGRRGHVAKDIHGNYLFSFGDSRLFRVSSNGDIEEFQLDHSVYEIFVDSMGELWISSIEGVVYHYTSLRANAIHRRVYFENADGTNRTVVRCEDHENGIWMAREGAGVFHIADRRHGLYSVASDHLIADEAMAITRANNDIVLGFRRKNALSIINSTTHKTVLHTNLKGFLASSQCFALHYDSLSNRLWVGANARFGCYKYPLSHESAPEKVYSILGHCYGIIPKENSNMLCALAAKSFTLLRDTTVVYRSDTFERNLTSACFTPEGELIIGSRGNGVRIFSFDSEYQATISHIPSIKVSSIARALDKTWIVSDRNLYHLNDNNQLEYFEVDSNNKVGLSSVYAFGNSLWITFGRGIYRISKGVTESRYTIETFPYATGLATLVKPGAALIHRKKIYIAAFGGVPVYDFSGLESFTRFEPPIVDRILMNGSALPRKGSYTLDYKQNSMNIELSAPHFKYGFQRFFRYKLEHDGADDGSWIELNKPGLNTLNFSHLSPGHYQLKAQIGASSLAWSNPMSMDMRIQPPYWQTWWFRAAILLGLALFVWLAVSYRYRTKQRQLQLELDAMSAHQKAMRSQMNPHFVFNVIASVQYLIKSSPEKAAKFLGHFSSLIRKVLDHSFVQWISLDSELGQLEDYLSLEQMRLNGSFEYEIDTSHLNESNKLLVPPALLQPYVENAVWHGLKTKENGGTLSIKLYSEEDNLKVVIEDNGPGRQQDNKDSNHKGHKSYGMLLSAERIKALNAEQGSFASVEVQDLESAAGVSEGTRVIIKLKARVGQK